MSCDGCTFRDECPLRRDYLLSLDDTNIGNLRELENKLELHEAFVSEMRKDLQKRIIELYNKK
jgi:hypothetical protein